MLAVWWRHCWLIFGNRLAHCCPFVGGGWAHYWVIISKRLVHYWPIAGGCWAHCRFVVGQCCPHCWIVVDDRLAQCMFVPGERLGIASSLSAGVRRFIGPFPRMVRRWSIERSRHPPGADARSRVSSYCCPPPASPCTGEVGAGVARRWRT